MRLLKPRPGKVWDDPAAIFDDDSVDHRHGAYALTPDGRSLLRVLGSPVRLVTVVHPDGDHHYEIARRGESPVRHDDDYTAVDGDTVEFEPEAVDAEASVGS